MTPQELKNSILQLAIQGKLVEQRPEEGTAAELLEKILAAKNAKGEKGNLTRSCGARGEKKTSVLSAPPREKIPDDEKPFDIPESWEWVRLGGVISLLSGRDLEPSEYSATPKKYPYMTGASNFANGNLLVNRWTDRPVTISHIGDLLITCKGTVGAMAFNAIGDIHIARQIMAISSESIDLHYVKVFLAASVQSLKAAANSMIPGIDRKTMLFRPIPLPPLAEQKRIVEKIEELLPLIDRYEKAWSKLEDFNKRFPVDMQKSVLQMAIQGKLVEQRPEEGTAAELLEKIFATSAFAKASADKKNTKDAKKNLTRSRGARGEKKVSALSAPPREKIPDDEKPLDIPESWEWVRFLSVVDIATNLVQPTGHENDRHIAPDNIEKGTGKLLECKTVAEDKVVSSNHRFFKGQVIYSKIRPLLRKVVIAPFDGLCSADMYPLNTQIDSSFLLFYMLSDVFNIQIAKAMSSRVKMPKINQEELSKVLLPLPPLAEQKRIVAKLEEILPLCEQLK